MLVRSMMLTDFRCPPLPMRGKSAEDGTDRVINSHDLMATFVAQTFRLSDETKNNIRRKTQEALCDRYLRDLLDAGESVDKAYDTMDRHTKEYMATYLMGTPFTVDDLHILTADQITPHIAKEIDHYGRALQIVVSGDTSPAPIMAVDYGSHNVVKSLLMRCVRSTVQYEKQSVVHEPVFKRMRNGVDAE